MSGLRKYDPGSLVLVGRMPGESPAKSKARRRALRRPKKKPEKKPETPPETPPEKLTAEQQEAIAERAWHRRWGAQR